MSERAMEKLQSRKTKPATFNLDMTLIGEHQRQHQQHHVKNVRCWYDGVQASVHF
jgi:alanine-glyoxylate transaminase/serine-glyoxylate transaminase/serine-pyruvate transaminase